MSYFATDWTPEDAPRGPLPVALNLEALYDGMLSALLSEQAECNAAYICRAGFGEAQQARFHRVPAVSPCPIGERVARLEAIRAKTREVERIKARLTRERQFNKRVAINAELRDAKLELERLASWRPPNRPPNQRVRRTTRMDKMKLHSPNLTEENIAKIRDLFPGCVTEAADESGKLRLAVDFDQLRQELSDHIVEGPHERYHAELAGQT